MVTPLVAVTGRRLGPTSRWPYAGACALPRSYLDAVARAGAQPVIMDRAADVDALLDRVDALVLTGGPDLDPRAYGEAPHPSVHGVDADEDAFERALVRAAVTRRVPTLAICRGIQVLNVACGGTLHQHIPDDPGVAPHGRPGEAGGGRPVDVELEPGSLLAGVVQATRVTGMCHHHQAVAGVGDGLRVVARADDGIVEGLEHDDAWLLAVQWHPEDTAAADAAQQRLFDALADRARRSRPTEPFRR